MDVQPTLSVKAKDDLVWTENAVVMMELETLRKRADKRLELGECGESGR